MQAVKFHSGPWSLWLVKWIPWNKLNWKCPLSYHCAFSLQHKDRTSLKQNPTKYIQAHANFLVSIINKFLVPFFLCLLMYLQWIAPAVGILTPDMACWALLTEFQRYGKAEHCSVPVLFKVPRGAPVQPIISLLRGFLNCIVVLC